MKLGQLPLDRQPAPGLMMAGAAPSRCDWSHCCIRSRLTGQWGISKSGIVATIPSGERRSQLRSTTCASVVATGCV